MHIFIVFKYVNLILRRETTFKGELAYILGIRREAELILGICEARQNTFR